MKFLKATVLGLAVTMAITVSTHATVSFLGTIADGTPSSDANEEAWVTHLLNMTQPTMAGTYVTDLFDGQTFRRNIVSNFGYTDVSFDHKVESGAVTVTGSYTGIVLGKYGSGNDPDQGIAVFYVNGSNQQLPASWGLIDGGGPITGRQALSHLTTFDAVAHVPDGGATLALMGIGLTGLTLFRRRN